MPKTPILTIVILLVLIYLYWKSWTKTITPKPEDIIERKGKQKERSPDDFNKSSEVFYEAEDFDLSSDEEEDNHSNHD